MSFIFFALVLLLLAYVLPILSPSFAAKRKSLFTLASVLLLVALLTKCFVQIQVGTVGVQTLFGKVKPEVLLPGLNTVNPLVDVTRFEGRTQNYTMSSIHTEGAQAGDDAIRVLSADGLEVVIDLTVLYHVVPTQAPNILAKIGEDYQDKIVRAISRTRIRDNAVYYDAVSLYSSRRNEFQARILAAIEKDFNANGLQLEQLLIRNIQLPQSVKRSIESKISAEQEAQKMQFVLQKERQEADRKRTEAQGIADYQRIVNTELSDKVLQYESIKAQQAIALSPNAKVIIMNGKTGPQVLVGDK
jgi:regulator of protease activity HflC (stomatin/prohibitin superfamily)